MNVAQELLVRRTESRPLRIVALAANPWDGQWMNRQQLLSRLAGRHTILYSNGPFRIWDRGKDEFRHASLFGSFEQRGGVMLDRRGRLPLRVPRLAWLDTQAMQLAARRWRKQLSEADGPLVAYLFHPAFAPLLDAVRPDRVVYHSYDLFRMTPNWSSAEEANEARLLAGRRTWCSPRRARLQPTCSAAAASTSTSCRTESTTTCSPLPLAIPSQPRSLRSHDRASATQGRSASSSTSTCCSSCRSAAPTGIS
jgi:hypothetical protein